MKKENDMHWNHRVKKETDENGEVLYSFVEAYYTKKNEVYGTCSVSPCGETKAELKTLIRRLKKALKQPTLKEKQNEKR